MKLLLVTILLLQGCATGYLYRVDVRDAAAACDGELRDFDNYTGKFSCYKTNGGDK